MDDDDLAAVLGFIELVEEHELVWRIVKMPNGYIVSVFVNGESLDECDGSVSVAIARLCDGLVAVSRRGIPKA